MPEHVNVFGKIFSDGTAQYMFVTQSQWQTIWKELPEDQRYLDVWCRACEEGWHQCLQLCGNLRLIMCRDDGTLGENAHVLMSLLTEKHGV